MILVAAVAVVFATIRGPEWMGMLWIWSLHSMIGATLCSPFVFFGRKRVHWGLLDLLAFLLPFAVWIVLWNASADGKSLANLIEPVFISFAFPVAALVRVFVGPRVRERGVSIGVVALLCLTAACIYWWTPILPE
jgi:hypothetical protein